MKTKGVILHHEGGMHSDVWDFFVEEITPEAKEFAEGLYFTDPKDMCERAEAFLKERSKLHYLGSEDNLHAWGNLGLLKEFEEKFETEHVYRGIQ